MSLKLKAPYHHGDLRNDLLRAARTEVARHGAQGVSMSSLALQAGVSQPAPYRHFADRNALFEALAAQGFEELSGLLQDAAAQVASDAAWKAMAAVYVSFGESNM